MTRLIKPVASLAILGQLQAQSPASAPDAWIQKAPLSADPSEILKFSALHPPRDGANVLELLEDSWIRVDAEGRKSIRYRYVYRVDHEAAVEGWGSVSIQWSPWHEARPAIRARVISQDGRVSSLDPKTVGEFTPDDQGNLVLGDQKHLRGPLPKLSKGSIVEVLQESQETVPFAKSGAMLWAPLQQQVPVIRTRTVMELPSGMPVSFKVYGLQGRVPQQTMANGWTRLSLDLGPQDPMPPQEAFLPPELSRAPAIALCTAESWGAVAREYSAIIESRMAGVDLSSWVADTVKGEVDRTAKISKILERLHREVRYTGVEFGDAAIVPATPAETLKRGFGDCKEKAALLVLLLRTAGIPAEVALVRSGIGSDVDPDLPALNGFNHVIAVVPGPSPLWIDATATHVQIGELPVGVEGHWALVAAPGTQGLVRIPELKASDNRQVELRRVEFSESGPGSIFETTEATGAFRQRYLNDREDNGEKQIREVLEKYVKENLSAKALGKLDYPAQVKGDGTFRMVIEARESSTVLMDRTHAAVTLKIWPLVSSLQDTLKAGRKDGDPAAKRLQDLLLPEPYSRVIAYSIPAPQGYAAMALPENRVVKFGPAQLHISHTKDASGVVEVRYRLDTEKRRWTASEVEEGLRAIKEFGEEKEPKILFSHVGEAHLAAGQIKEALDEFQKVSLANPDKALPHTRIARALLLAGLGQAARQEAQKAVSLEPRLAAARETLGWVLQHDMVGRRFGAGWDRPGALAAYREAKNLDPKSFSVRGNLAILLEYDSDGNRYSAASDLAAATEEYKGIREELQDKSLDENLLISLLRQGKDKEALEFGKKLPVSRLRDRSLLVALVHQVGLDQAMRDSEALLTDAPSRRRAWAEAADDFIRERRYAEAARALAEGSNGSEQVSQLRARSELLSTVRTVQPDTAQRKTPVGLVRQFFLALLRSPKDPGKWSDFFAPAFREALSRYGSEKIVGDLKRGMSGIDMPLEAVADLTLSLGQFTSTGDDAKGHQVSLRMPDNSTHTFFVGLGPAGEGYRIVGSEDDLGTLGLEALWLVEHGQAPRARAWLDQARQWLASPPADDPVGGSTFGRLWTLGQEADEGRTRLAAALLASDMDGPKAGKIIEQAKDATSVPLERARLELALARIALDAKEYAKAEAILSNLRGLREESKAVNRTRVRTFLLLKKWDEALEEAAVGLRLDPRSSYLLGARRAVFRGKGGGDRYEQEIQDQIDRGLADADAFNSLAWSHVSRDSVSERTLALARSATQGSNASSAASMHTLASVLALLGKTSDARDALTKSLSLRGPNQRIGANEWFVLGCIAEKLELNAVAVDCFHQAMASPREADADDADGCLKLSARRAARLKGGAPPR